MSDVEINPEVATPPTYTATAPNYVINAWNSRPTRLRLPCSSALRA